MSPTDLRCEARARHDGVLIVSAEGVYRPGSDGNADAQAIEAAIEGARGPESAGLVLDLSGLSYSGGDALGALLVRLAAGTQGPPLLTVLVVSEANRPALRSLLELMGRKADRWLHPSRDVALRALRTASPGGSCDP